MFKLIFNLTLWLELHQTKRQGLAKDLFATRQNVSFRTESIMRVSEEIGKSRKE